MLSHVEPSLFVLGTGRPTYVNHLKIPVFARYKCNGMKWDPCILACTLSISIILSRINVCSVINGFL